VKIDLTAVPLFESDTIDLDKKVTVILGKNGTGKTTMTDVLSEQTTNYDVSVFKGFENIIDDNKRLNAVVLGEENASINKQIEDIRTQIKQKENEKNDIKRNLEDPNDETKSNFWTRRNDAQEKYDDAEREISVFYTKAASSVKKKLNMASQYNRKNFVTDIVHASLLNTEEKEQYENTLKSEILVAPVLHFPSYDMNDFLVQTNNLLEKKVQEKTHIVRLETPEKRIFAEQGLKLHKKGEVCAFCGSPINNKVYEELETYFSADEVKALKNEIDTLYQKAESAEDALSDLVVQSDNFYPQFQERVKTLTDGLNTLADAHRLFFTEIKKALAKKQSNLFDVAQKLALKVPDDFETLKNEYDKLVAENNSNDLEQKKTEALEKIRLHYVKEELNNFDYDTKQGQISILKSNLQQRKDEFFAEKQRITGPSGINTEIRIFQDKIVMLQNKTKNEAILAQRIKNKLRNMVSFELEVCKDEKSNGIYMVKDIYTGEIRDITLLSTGEKNIIAFLYFLEKLNEVKDVISNKPRLIVFDDPMNSNDDNMQYLIIEEIVRLIKALNPDDRFVLLTHNKHFYMNVTYGFKRKEKEIKRIHFNKNGQSTTFIFIPNSDKDIKTSYESLWMELKFIYDSDASADMMLNPIRRIIETFTKFNGLKQSDFCAKVSGAKKLFDVNSHSIDDLEAELNGKTKDEIKQIFVDCFKENNYVDHVIKYWPECESLANTNITFTVNMDSKATVSV